MTVIAALYGIETNSGQSYQFLSDTVKHANKKSSLPIFNVTNMTRYDLIAMGIDPVSGRRPRWLSLTSYGMTILKDFDKLMYE
ncbi:Antirepressor protein C-terminal domain-containing protein [Vibrio crassostreae]|nr:Antirepressor protein C-terminal domain-containing protein [Vibrio crassostreae]CAK3045818.1 Antirepressor protein C-terminal domain-containing protein [Vibrio crassostreae]CAK3585048.1 Antirepressor protein C-terminal domain-containing protein [Vibrio crassostreae]CAK3984991.1 Antirepressor protein C-terminal domain-containing protein [Vibrio crassostreae]